MHSWLSALACLYAPGARCCRLSVLFRIFLLPFLWAVGPDARWRSSLPRMEIPYHGVCARRSVATARATSIRAMPFSLFSPVPHYRRKGLCFFLPVAAFICTLLNVKISIWPSTPAVASAPSLGMPRASLHKRLCSSRILDVERTQWIWPHGPYGTDVAAPTGCRVGLCSSAWRCSPLRYLPCAGA